jgi:heme A synthase
MRTGAGVLLAWAVLLGASMLALVAFGDRTLAWGLLGWAAGAVLVHAVWRRLRPREEVDRIPVPDTSVPTAVVVSGLAIVVLGLEFGAWVIGIGAFVLVLGVAALLHERMTEARR